MKNDEEKKTTYQIQVHAKTNMNLRRMYLLPGQVTNNPPQLAHS